MRVASSVTAISWIPMEAVSKGLARMPFSSGMAHYDAPPPDPLGDVEALRARDGFRFANVLRAWIEVEDGRVVARGQEGGGLIGATTLRLGERDDLTFQAVPYPDLRPSPRVSGTEVTFVQTAGGRTGAPAPRRVKRFPFVQLTAPSAWTTLALTLRTDGTSDWKLLGASPFPRHWIYDHRGRLAAKSGLIDFEAWYREGGEDETPWGGVDTPARVVDAQSVLERSLSAFIVDGSPRWRRLEPGEVLVVQGDPGVDLFLLMDGILSVEVDGTAVVEVGPGAVLGEGAILEGGRRSATLRAVTACRVGQIAPGRLDRDKLQELRRGRAEAAGG